jgi:uncharacterized membrane protein
MLSLVAIRVSLTSLRRLGAGFYFALGASAGAATVQVVTGPNGLPLSNYALSPDGLTVVGEENQGEEVTAGIVWDAANGATVVPHLPRKVANGGTTQIGETNRVPSLYTADAEVAFATLFDANIRNNYVLSADGSTIGGTASVSGSLRSFLWSEADGVTDLGDLLGGPIGTWINDLSADGSVAVGQSYSAQDSRGSAAQAYRWENGTMTPLDFLGGGINRSSAMAVTADGQIAVGGDNYEFLRGTFRQTGPRAVMWSADGSATALGLLEGALTSIAHDVSSDGSLVVGESEGQGVAAAFLWDPNNGIRPLSAALRSSGVEIDAELVRNPRISDDGTTILCSDGSQLYYISGIDPSALGALVPDSPIPEWADLVYLGGGWWSSDWFGLIYTSDEWSFWVYHEAFGFILVVPTDDGVWLWDASLGWSWTHPTLFPHLWHSASQGWLYYHIGSEIPNRYFYDFTAGGWKLESEL